MNDTRDIVPGDEVIIRGCYAQGKDNGTRAIVIQTVIDGVTIGRAWRVGFVRFGEMHQCVTDKVERLEDQSGKEPNMIINTITDHPLRLAIGSHVAGSGQGCAMNVISWENGDSTITGHHRRRPDRLGREPRGQAAPARAGTVGDGD